MERLFLGIYRYFRKHKPACWIVFGVVVVALGLAASRIELEEDVTRIFPDDERVQKLNTIFSHARLAERVVVMVSVKDSTSQGDPEALVTCADTLAARIQAQLGPYVKKVSLRVDDVGFMQVFRSIPHNLPVYLDSGDYVVLDSLSRPDVARRALQENYRQLLSPVGMVTKHILAEDPLGFSFLVLRKLRRLQYDDNFELFDNCIITRDGRHLLFFIQPAYPPSETRHNADFLEALQQQIDAVEGEQAGLCVSYFGAPVVAVGNAQQLRADTVLTVGLMLVLLLAVLLGYFKRKRVPFLILIPVAFGALFSIACLSMLQEQLSVLALAVGAVVLGIAINYSLHYLVILKFEGSAEAVIRELARPLTIGSTTTVLAFFCLQFTNASVLRDIGLFAGFSLVGAALCSLVFLPHMLPEHLFPPAGNLDKTRSWLSRERQRQAAIAILIATPVFFYFAGDVTFNSDMSRLNFMRPEVQQAQHRLETLNQASLSSVYVVADGATLEQALRKSERAVQPLESMRGAGVVNKISSLSWFIVSDSLRQVRVAKWHSFWAGARRDELRAAVWQEGTSLGFSPKVLQRFDSLLLRPYHTADTAAVRALREAFFNDYIIERPGDAMVISLANVPPEKKQAVYDGLHGLPVHLLDRQMLTNLFVEYVNEDFNFIITFTAALVFLALLLVYGRIELTLMTFLPMAITWIWILGIMALAGIPFNIVNVMVSTFIFGLGDDYSIFTMDGLLQDYKTGRKVLPAVRTSIVLSALTTVCGLGVLVFAQHPALKSIAAISIIGIVCVFIMAQTVQPFLFRLFISGRTARGLAPATLWGIVKSIFVFAFFIAGCLLLTVIGVLLKLVPMARARMRLLYHQALQAFTFANIAIGPNASTRIRGRTADTFSRPSVIIANHTSFLDILLTTMLHPKIIMLTNRWVWESPIFGGVVRLADYYPVMEGAEASADQLRARVAEGYSVVVFPEGTRSSNGAIGRFHKGAFYLAEALQLPVQPLLIHGARDGIRKGDFYLNNSRFTLQFLPPIAPEDARFGLGYSERTKRICRYFRESYRDLAAEAETPAYYRYWLVSNYLYKGPVLEWYLRIKLRLEKDYAPFDQLVPGRATVLDLGCGYGFLSYMLQLLSAERTIAGVDYDEEKIAVAQHGYLRGERLQFTCADVTTYPFAAYDVIIISDVLHYLLPDAQEQLLVRCFNALNAGGKLLVRDGNTDWRLRHRGTRLTELFSVKLLRFNKASNPLHFISGAWLKSLAEKHGMVVTEHDDASFTSNVIFEITARK